MTSPFCRTSSVPRTSFTMLCRQPPAAMLGQLACHAQHVNSLGPLDHSQGCRPLRTFLSTKVAIHEVLW